jgi:hypothetical protein
MTIAYAGHELAFTDTPQMRPDAGELSRDGFIVAEAERGPLYPVRCTSLAAVVAKFGGRQSYSYLYDSAEAFFAESGGAPLWVSRVASSTATVASRNLSDGSATTLVASVMGPGTYGNSLSIQIRTNADDSVGIPSGSFQIRIIEGGVIIEDSPVFVDKSEALLWAPSNGQGNAQTFKLADSAGTGDPVQLAASVFGSTTSGADNRGGIVDADWQAALDRFTIDLGPGQVFMPGQTTSARQLMLAAHSRTRNRHATYDVPDTPTVATLVSAMTAINAAPLNGARFGSAYWPWYQIPPISGAFGYRTIPPSAAVAGLMARAEVEGGDAGIAAAGEEHGVFRFVTGLSQDPAILSDTNLTSLDDAGLNVAMRFAGISNPVQYGNRTPRNRSTDAVWAEASGSRVVMAIGAELDSIMRRYVHTRATQIRLGQLQGELGNVLTQYRVSGALYGASDAEAFSVDSTSEQVNPASELEAGRLKAVVSLRTTPSPNRVRLEIARVSITRSL